MLNKIIQKTILISTLIVIIAVPSQAQFLCGDVNETETINVADLVYMVDYVFRGGAEPLPYLSGDCDLNGEVNISDLVFLVNFLFKGGPEPCSEPCGSMVSYTGCLKSVDTIESNWDCIEYEYNGGNLLTLKHVNAGFNCCPVIGVDISVEDNLIMIVESETYDSLGPCYCLCLFDLDFEITNLPIGTYTIIVEQLYLDGEDELMEFTLDLTSTPIADSYCIFRDHYPWGW